MSHSKFAIQNSSFSRYPKYKDSGVEWLGEVPEGWRVTALKRGFNVTLGKMLQPESKSPDDELQPYLRAANIQWAGVETSDIKRMWMSKRDRAHLRLEDGDLLVSEGGDVGRSCLWTGEIEECYFQNSVNRVRARDGDSNSYLRYWMSTIKDKGYIDVLCNKSTIAHFTAEKVASVPVPFPPPAEQTAIAAFLNRETAKIDGLVAQQRRLMELLKEKRQAVISAAVTGRFIMANAELRMANEQLELHELPSPVRAEPNQQGQYQASDGRFVVLFQGRLALSASDLDPTSSHLRHSKFAILNSLPSGIEWLGDVPEHWRALAVKHLARDGKKTFTDGDWIESPYVTGEGVRLIQTGNIRVGYYNEQGFRYISEETFDDFKCTEVMPRDVLICRLDGPVGRACLAPDLGVRMITSVDNAILKCADDILPEYVVAILSSVPWISWIDALCRVGGGFRLRVSRSQLGEIRVPIPPFEEQRAIVEHLESETGHFDTLTAEAQRAIDLLQERRTALISAAVTGQIDVRNAIVEPDAEGLHR